jgi:hypothetical protein
MTCRLAITFGFLAMTAAMSGAGCSDRESSRPSPAAATGGAGATGTGASGGAAASGAQGGTSVGGAAGGATGGSGPTGQVGTLGQSCGAPGTLACAGNYQKLTLICGADGKWAAGQTCTGNQICDTRAGVNAGTCQDQDPQCLGHEPGYKFCVGAAVYACGADNLSTVLVESCTGTCENGACNNAADPCPASGIICSSDCGGPSAACTSDAGVCDVLWPTSNIVGTKEVVRTPAATQACACSSGRKYIQLASRGTSAVKVTAPAPWWLFAVPSVPQSLGDTCTTTDAPQCLVVQGVATTYLRQIAIVTDDPAAPVRNVTFETVAAGTTCP